MTRSTKDISAIAEAVTKVPGVARASAWDKNGKQRVYFTCSRRKDGYRVSRCEGYLDVATGDVEFTVGCDAGLIEPIKACLKPAQPEQSEDASSIEDRYMEAMAILLRFGRDKTDDGFCRALAELSREDGAEPLPRDRMLEIIRKAKLLQPE